MSKKDFLIKNGHVMAVIRPSDPKRAIAAAYKCTNQAEMNAVLQDPEQEYTFAGIASKDGANLLDANTGEVIDALQPGDSFVRFDQIEELFPVGEA